MIGFVKSPIDRTWKRVDETITYAETVPVAIAMLVNGFECTQSKIASCLSIRLWFKCNNRKPTSVGRLSIFPYRRDDYELGYWRVITRTSISPLLHTTKYSSQDVKVSLANLPRSLPQPIAGCVTIVLSKKNQRFRFYATRSIV